MVSIYLAQRGVGYEAVEVDGALVGQVLKDVEGPYSFWAALLVAKNEVDPLVQLAWYELAFQGLLKNKSKHKNQYSNKINNFIVTAHVSNTKQHNAA